MLHNIRELLHITTVTMTMTIIQ